MWQDDHQGTSHGKWHIFVNILPLYDVSSGWAPRENSHVTWSRLSRKYFQKQSEWSIYSFPPIHESQLLSFVIKVPLEPPKLDIQINLDISLQIDESSQPSPQEVGHVSAGLPRELRLKAGQDDDQIEDKTNIDNRKHSPVVVRMSPSATDVLSICEKHCERWFVYCVCVLVWYFPSLSTDI